MCDVLCNFVQGHCFACLRTVNQNKNDHYDDNNKSKSQTKNKNENKKKNDRHHDRDCKNKNEGKHKNNIKNKTRNRNRNKENNHKHNLRSALAANRTPFTPQHAKVIYAVKLFPCCSCRCLMTCRPDATIQTKASKSRCQASASDQQV